MIQQHYTVCVGLADARGVLAPVLDVLAVASGPAAVTVQAPRAYID